VNTEVTGITIAETPIAQINIVIRNLSLFNISSANSRSNC